MATKDHMAFAVVVLAFFQLLSLGTLEAATVEFNLTIAQEIVELGSRPVPAMTINGAIPGPTLRFKEGDVARIRVHNTMDVETSIHWHGLLVPPEMDGVPLVSFPPIGAGSTFTYEFPIRQAGTYWYHSHTSLQEQRGLYGAIVIDPANDTRQTDQDHVILLSDWTDEDPHEVLRTLKRGSEWYALQKGSGQSILGAAKLGMLSRYFKRELQRMPAMDISDVAYDSFLANGSSEATLEAEPGETVRLRIVNGSATTYFHCEFVGSPMTIIAADGIDVEAITQDRFLIAVAETYDLLVQVPAVGSYEFRATAHDGSGSASVWIGSGPRHPAPHVPSPNLYHLMGHMAHLSLGRLLAPTPNGTMGMTDAAVSAGGFDRPGMMGMAGMGMHGNVHSNQDAQTHRGHGSRGGEDTMAMVSPLSPRIRDHRRDLSFLGADLSNVGHLAPDGTDPARPWPPYADLRATSPTEPPGDRKAREIRLTLDGDMERYVWLLNNKPLSDSDVIAIRDGEVARFIMINRTMMHHPMHLHGHFFRVINGQGEYAPLKHTVNVAPMSTTVIEFDANEKGDWFFHCHLLYHMKSGMARLIHYDGFSPDPGVAAIRQQLYQDSWYSWGMARGYSSMTEGSFTVSNTRNTLAARWELGWQNIEGAEWEGIITWDRSFNRFFGVFVGANVGDALDDERGLFGIRYLLPLNMELTTWLDTDGGARVMLDKSFDLTPRLALSGEAEYDTHNEWEGAVDLDYMLTKTISLLGRWHSEYGLGIGAEIRF